MNLSPMKKLFAGLALATLLLAPACRLHAQEPATPAATSASGSTSTPEAQSPEKNKQEEDENEAFRHSAAVKAIGAKLGLDPDQAATAFTVLNFAVLAILIGWFLLKTLPKTFRNRNTAIQKHLVEARTATEEANVRLNSVEARLSKLDEQIAALRGQSEKDAANDEQRIKASVEEEIAAASSNAQRQLQQYAANLAIEQAARKLVVTAETDRLLVQDFARRLTGNDSKEGHN